MDFALAAHSIFGYKLFSSDLQRLVNGDNFVTVTVKGCVNVHAFLAGKSVTLLAKCFFYGFRVSAYLTVGFLVESFMLIIHGLQAVNKESRLQLLFSSLRKSSILVTFRTGKWLVFTCIES